MGKTKTQVAAPALVYTRPTLKQDFKRNWLVYVLFLPALIYEIVLHYIPMFGIVMAFEDYKVNLG